MTTEEKIEGRSDRLAAIEGRLAHLQTVGTWLFAGLLASYAATFGAYGAILVVALRTTH